MNQYIIDLPIYNRRLQSIEFIQNKTIFTSFLYSINMLNAIVRMSYDINKRVHFNFMKLIKDKTFYSYSNLLFLLFMLTTR